MSQEEDEYRLSDSATLSEYIQNMKETLGLLTWIWREFVSESARKHMKRFYAMNFLSRVISLVYPYLMGVFIDAMMRQDTQLMMVSVAGTFLAHTVTMFIEWSMGNHIEMSLGKNLVSLEKRLNELFFSKNLGLHVQESSKLTASNMEKGLGRFHMLQEVIFFGAMDQCNTLIIGFVLLTLLSPISGAIVFTCLLFNMAISLFLNRMIVTKTGAVDAGFRKYNRMRNEHWDHVERVITSGNGKRDTDKMDKEYRKVWASDRNIWLRYIAYSQSRNAVNIVTISLVMYYVGMQGLQGIITVEAAIPILTWTGMVTAQIRMLARSERMINWAAPSIRSLRDALLTPPTITEAPDAISVPIDKPVSISFENVGHSYGDEKSPAVLRDVSFEVPAGKTVALIGATGCGKSTLTKLLQRYDDPTTGVIRINGTDLRETELSSWRHAIGYIAQRPQVFTGTIRENLVYGLPEEQQQHWTDERIMKMLQTLGIDFGDRLVNGLDTKVGKNGIKLSGGEKQRLMIAAAAIKKPRCMIIDEATSSLDAGAQASVQAGISKILAGDASAIVIAHRLSTILDCDRFVVLRSTDELNAHESQIETIADSVQELWEQSPIFRKLAQLEGVNIVQTA